MEGLGSGGHGVEFRLAEGFPGCSRGGSIRSMPRSQQS